MPHATETTVNGEQYSQFLNHLTSLPVVNDSIETFKANPYGKKSLQLADGIYARFGKPVEPYLETPLSYAKPYALKADELADSGLDHVEARFPIVKEKTNTIIETGKSYILWPYKYLSNTWSDEYSKTASHNDRGAGITTSVLAIVSTELKITSDFFHVLADFLGPKYEESKKKGSDYVRQVEDTAEQYKKYGQDKLNQYAKIGQTKLSEAQKEAQKKGNDASKVANEKATEIKQSA